MGRGSGNGFLHSISCARAASGVPDWVINRGSLRRWTGNSRQVTSLMSVHVYGCNHLAIEVDDVKAAVKFYEDVFNLKKLKSGEGDAFFQLGDRQFLAIFEVREAPAGPDPALWDHGPGRRAGGRSAEEGRRKVWAEINAAFPMRFPRSVGQPHSGGRSP